MEPKSDNQELSRPGGRNSFSRAIDFLGKMISPVNQLGVIISGAMLFAMLALTTVDVIGARLAKWQFVSDRTDFFKPIIGGQDLTELIMLIFIAFGLANMAFRKGHIRVDLVVQHVGRKANLWLDIVAYFCAFAFYVLIAVMSFIFGMDNLRDGSVSPVLTLPYPPFNILLTIGAGLTALIFLRDFLKSIQEVMG